MDIAQARLQSNAPDKAVHALLEAERIAPQEVRCRLSTQQLLALLLKKANGNSTKDLHDMAQRAGVWI